MKSLHFYCIASDVVVNITLSGQEAQTSAASMWGARLGGQNR